MTSCKKGSIYLSGGIEESEGRSAEGGWGNTCGPHIAAAAKIQFFAAHEHTPVTLPDVLRLNSCCRFSKHGSLKSHEELELPSELTEDWATMEVCVDCKKFISDIIASSKHSLSLATKRARLKRKTQSFYMSSPKGREEYRPSERTIKEI